MPLERASLMNMRYDWRKIAAGVIVVPLLWLGSVVNNATQVVPPTSVPATPTSGESTNSHSSLTIGATMDLPNTGSNTQFGSTIVLPEQQTIIAATEQAEAMTPLLATATSTSLIAVIAAGQNTTLTPPIGATVALPNRPTQGPATATLIRPTVTIVEGSTIALPTLTATLIPTATPIPTATLIPSATPIPTATLIPSATPIPTATLIPTDLPTLSPLPTVKSPLALALTPIVPVLTQTTQAINNTATALPTQRSVVPSIVPTVTPLLLPPTPSPASDVVGVVVTSTTAPAATIIPIRDLRISLPLEGAQIPIGPITIVGTGPPGRMVEVLNGDQLLGTARVQRDSTWQVNIVTTEHGVMSLMVRLLGSDLIEHRPVRILIGEQLKEDTCTSMLPGCDVWVTRNGRLSLRMRVGPGTDQAIVTLLPVGTQVQILEPSRTVANIMWWRIRTIGGSEGWVGGENLVLKPD